MPTILLAEGAEEFALVRDFAIIMAVAGAAVVLFRKINQPPILGYLIAGLIVGPFTLPNPPITNIESIRLLADLGLVLLLFALGLEFGWRRIRQVGFGVLVIGALEILTMISLGYWVGWLLGWTTQESIFLGAALSISSSAILVKVLRDTGRLTSTSGRLIVGILVVEDFAAVILLTLLSGIATTGTAELGDVIFLVMKLALFAVASLALGAVIVPRIIKFVAGFGSRETLLLTGLAFCFYMALIGQSLGISAAAGAFLIGAVIGDTDESKEITEIIEPIRDMFAALFFVSIGMLIDVGLIKDHIVPALIISGVFVVGKMVANTAGTFVAGQGGRVPIQVGLGMPQIGEFSLAMMKIGAEHEAIRAFIYQVVAGVTAITSLVYPYIARSADPVAGFLERRTPRGLRRPVTQLSAALQSFRSSIAFDNEFARRIRRASIPIAINFLIIVVLVGTGTMIARFATQIAVPLGISEGTVGTITGVGTLLLCLPSAIALWRSLQHLSDEATSHFLLRRRFGGVVARERLRIIIRDSILVLLVIVIGIWTIPLALELLSLGFLAAPLPLLVLAGIGFLAFRILRRMHSQLETSFGQTFAGIEPANPSPTTPTVQPTPPANPLPTPETAGEDPPPRAPELEPPMNEDPPPEAASRIPLGEAELIALHTVSGDLSPYRRHLKNKELVWNVKEISESFGNHRVVLTFREAGSPDDNVGEEELYLDQSGHVQFRQIRHWPSTTPRPRFLLWAIVSAVLLTAIAAAALVLLQWRPTITLP